MNSGKLTSAFQLLCGPFFGIHNKTYQSFDIMLILLAVVSLVLMVLNLKIFPTDFIRNRPIGNSPLTQVSKETLFHNQGTPYSSWSSPQKVMHLLIMRINLNMLTQSISCYSEPNSFQFIKLHTHAQVAEVADTPNPPKGPSFDT